MYKLDIEIKEEGKKKVAANFLDKNNNFFSFFTTFFFKNYYCQLSFSSHLFFYHKINTKNKRTKFSMTIIT